MGFTPLTFTKSWENPQDFPTYEPDEAQVRADLQLLHNESRDALNRLIEGLSGPDAAGQLPFRPEGGLTAQTVQEAVLEVYGSVQDAAAGLLVDGSITKDKLAQSLLERVYGGRVWVSMELPDGSRNPETDFPVGQLWLRPGCTLVNRAPADWQLQGGRAQTTESGLQLVSDGTQAFLQGTMACGKLGRAGGPVLVWLTCPGAEPRPEQLTLYCNGQPLDLSGGGGFLRTALDSRGELELVLSCQWPQAAAGQTVTLSRPVVLPLEEAQLPFCHPTGSWETLLRPLVPFEQAELGRKLLIQECPGSWTSVDEGSRPVNRGGTGLERVTPGGLLVGRDQKALGVVEPGAAGDFLRMGKEGPRWENAEGVFRELGLTHLATGTYVGSGGKSRTLTLPQAPALVQIFSPGTNPITLANGAREQATYTVKSHEGLRPYGAWVSLRGKTLTFGCEDGFPGVYQEPAARHGNDYGVVYTWVALNGGSWT